MSATGGRTLLAPAEADASTSRRVTASSADDVRGHRPMAVYVTVAVYRPGGTTGSGDVKLTLVGQASPLAALVAAVVPTRRSGAGAMGIAALAPAAS